MIEVATSNETFKTGCRCSRPLQSIGYRQCVKLYSLCYVMSHDLHGER